MIYGFKVMTNLALILVTFLALPLAQAAQQARLYLQNVPLQDERLLVVNILLADVADLYGAELQLRYDPTQLRVRDDNPRLDGAQIVPGPLLAFDNRFVATNQANPQTGLITFVFTLLKPAPAISGEGVLATIVFEISGDGPFVVEVVKAKLVSATLEPIPATTTGLSLDGQPETTIRPPDMAVTSPSETLYRLSGREWGFIGLLFLLVAAGWLTLLRSEQAAPQPEHQLQTPPRPIPGAPRSTVLSSILLAEQGNVALSHSEIEKAYELFSRAIELDPVNTTAWLGKGLVAQHDMEKRICFERVLALDPGNATAREALRQLEGRK